MPPYTLKRLTRSRSIRVRVEPSGRVLVTAPKRASRYQIENFVLDSANWIDRQRQKLSLRKLTNPTLDWNRNIIMYLGKLYQLRLRLDYKLPKVELTPGIIEIAPITGLKTDAPKTLMHWLRNNAKDYFKVHVPKWSQTMKIPYRSIRLRQQKSRWGSCSSKGTLSFNWRLVHFKPEVINYVIIHELAHIRHMNHSPDFWKLVNKYDPRYRTHMRFLKQQVIEIN